jgi:hypothetical protein
MDKNLLPGFTIDFTPDGRPTMDEAVLLDILAVRVEEMMRDDLDLLLSTLYRLDVYEHKIKAALQSPEIPPALGLARLILERQKEKIATRLKYASKKNDQFEI